MSPNTVPMREQERRRGNFALEYASIEAAERLGSTR